MVPRQPVGVPDGTIGPVEVGDGVVVSLGEPVAVGVVVGVPVVEVDGDGVLTGLMIASRLAENGKSLAELAAVMTRLPQVLVNVPDVDKDRVDLDEGVQEAVRQESERLGDTGRVLLDYVPEDEDLPDEIRSAIETGSDQVTDLHVWQLGPGHHGAIVAIRSKAPLEPAAYRARLSHIHDLSHLTIEVERTA